MLLITGQRRGEVAGMKWSEIIPMDGVCRQSAPRREKAIWSPCRASPGNFWMPCHGSVTTSSEPTSTRRCRDGVRQGAAPSADTLDHHRVAEDTRHGHRAVCESFGVDRLTINKMLNHAESGITKIYDRYSANPEKTAAIERWANKVREIITGKSPENVVPMRRRRASKA